MALKKQSRNRQDRKARALVPPLPHSSWRLAPADAAVTPVASASEFWSRLGL
jgi:hypothetical protein